LDFSDPMWDLSDPIWDLSCTQLRFPKSDIGSRKSYVGFHRSRFALSRSLNWIRRIRCRTCLNPDGFSSIRIVIAEIPIANYHVPFTVEWNSAGRLVNPRRVCGGTIFTSLRFAKEPWFTIQGSPIISVSISLRSSMSAPVLPLLMVVINRAGTCSSARADERTFPAADQRPSSRPYGCTDAYALRGLAFSGFRVSMTPALTARNRNRQREREHQ